MAQGAEKTLRQMFGAYGLKVIGLLATVVVSGVVWFAVDVREKAESTRNALGDLQRESGANSAVLSRIEKRLDQVDVSLARGDERSSEIRDRLLALETQVERIVDAVVPYPTATPSITATRTATPSPEWTQTITPAPPVPFVAPHYVPNQ